MLMSPRKSSSVRYASGEMDNVARLPMPVVKQDEEGTKKEAEPQLAVGVSDVTPWASLNGEATLAGNSVGEPQSKDIGRKASKSSRKKPSTHITRRPPTTAVLLPAHRYCSKDEIVKPYRAHHCRACGTVSLAASSSFLLY
jgi:palmitoyltransferase